ncbi:MAG: hypothetical protein QXI16_04190 [Sulfolobaceae archaeon]
MENLFIELWEIAKKLLMSISNAFDWLFQPMKFNINIPIKIPLILENGIEWSWNVGVTPISLLGVGLLGMLAYWFIWGR